MRIAITGANGQLGLALRRALYDDEVIAYGHAELDITDASAVMQALEDRRPDAVIHAAAWTDTAACEEDPARAIEVNGHGAGNVAKACARTGAVMLYVSSNEVFDGETEEPYLEDAQTDPVNHYGRSKLEGERQVQDGLGRHQIVRTSWLYGPGRLSFPEKIVKAANEQGSLRLVTDEIASPTWTIDLANALSALVRTEESGVFHLTNAGYCSRKEWAEEVLRLARLGSVTTEATTLAEFGGARKPVFSALANALSALVRTEESGVFHLTNAGYCSRKEWAEEVLRLARLGSVRTEATTLSEFGGLRKPVFSALANTRAAKLGITMRNWQLALLDHFRTAVRSN